MPSHYQSYVHNLNRVLLLEMIDHFEMNERLRRAKPSLVVQPLTGRFYADRGRPEETLSVIDTVI